MAPGNSAGGISAKQSSARLETLLLLRLPSILTVAPRLHFTIQIATLGQTPAPVRCNVRSLLCARSALDAATAGSHPSVHGIRVIGAKDDCDSSGDIRNLVPVGLERFGFRHFPHGLPHTNPHGEGTTRGGPGTGHRRAGSLSQLNHQIRDYSTMVRR